MRKSRLINIPERYGLSDYDKAVESFIEHYRKHQDIIAIYQFGNVSAPGISDLDFIVVLRDKLNAPFDNEYSICRFSKDLRYLYNDTQPFLMPINIFKNFYKIFPVSSLKLLYSGDHYNFEYREENKGREVFRLLSLIDICIYFYPAIFLRELFSETLNVRFSLLILNSLKFALAIASEICGNENDRWKSYVTSSTNLRHEWFDLDDKAKIQSLKELLEEASGVSAEMVQSLDAHIQTHCWKTDITPPSSGSRIFHCSFISSYDPEDIILREKEFYENNNGWSNLLPLSFMYPAWNYARQNGPVSNHIKTYLSLKGDFPAVCINPYISEHLNERISCMNRHAAFYSENRIKIPMVHNYYFYDPVKKNSGLISSIINFFNEAR
ncbi:MAG: hypothetical protein HY757_05530 [Nitrospirae bacterium]|nr:hypothetical protein [Nitrospirota bacterium]